MIILTFVLLAAATVLFAIRAFRGPSVADRVVAVDAMVIVAIAAIATEGVRTGDARFADAAILLALIAFVGTGTVARFIERRGG
ncbi:MAG TPA: monovalent cation/H+ antiporter complex subunit F [Acidimicrobiales bacterium]|nr:monovalent cation/H+ antiporter complex subunit F [Acidimicrobiales bacterium]